jgi:hypothetical protein
MKNIILLGVLLASTITMAQSTQTPTAKIAQGFVVSGITNLLLLQTDTFEEQPILRHAVSMLGAMVSETALNGINSNKFGYVVLGSVSVSVTIEIFKPQRRTYSCQRRSIW